MEEEAFDHCFATSVDLNGDGKLDVVALNRGSVAVLLDTGCLP